MTYDPDMFKQVLDGMAVGTLSTALFRTNQSKSVWPTTFQIHKGRPLDPKLAGFGFNWIWMDEWGEFNQPKILPPSQAEAVFETKAFPAATVSVIRKTGETSDPRNPNPAAGRRVTFVIKVGERQVGQEHHSVAVAKSLARQMHERLVKALKEDMEKINPNYGRF